MTKYNHCAHGGTNTLWYLLRIYNWHVTELRIIMRFMQSRQESDVVASWILSNRSRRVDIWDSLRISIKTVEDNGEGFASYYVTVTYLLKTYAKGKDTAVLKTRSFNFKHQSLTATTITQKVLTQTHWLEAFYNKTGLNKLFLQKFYMFYVEFFIGISRNITPFGCRNCCRRQIP